MLSKGTSKAASSSCISWGFAQVTRPVPECEGKPLRFSQPNVKNMHYPVSLESFDPLYVDHGLGEVRLAYSFNLRVPLPRTPPMR